MQRVVDTGYVKHRCVSFAHVVKLRGLPSFIPGAPGALKVCTEAGVGIMMDSGVFSLRSYKRKLLALGKSLDTLLTEDEYVSQYVDFCKAYSKRWDFYVTVDMVKVQSVIYKLHIRLQEMGIRPTPVYHGDSSIDYLRRYADQGYKLICIGTQSKARHRSNKRRDFLGAIFEEGEKLGLKYHALGVTAAWQMINYPWWSLDSSSWSQYATFGSIVTFDPKTRRLDPVHVSDRACSVEVVNSRVLEAVREHVEAEGFIWKDLRTDMTARHCYNAKTMYDLAKYCTKRHRSVSEGTWGCLV